MDKLIITIAPNGENKTKEDTPYVPIMVNDVVDDVVACYKAGASIAHLHGRDEVTQGIGFDVDYYKRVVDGIRGKCDIVINVSTGGVTDNQRERLNGLEANPEIASLNVGSVNFKDFSWSNSPKLIEEFADVLFSRGIKANLEVFDLSHVDNGIRIIESGKYFGPPAFDVLMGSPGALQYNVNNLMAILNNLPKSALWNSVGFNHYQLPIACQAIMQGGHIRVGIEDNIYYKEGQFASNVELVERIVRLAKELGREIATPDEAREMLGLKKR